MERAGATVIYDKTNEGHDLRYRLDRIKAQMEAMEHKPDVLFIYHPRMDFHEISWGCGPFETNPTILLANAAKEMGIPTLIQDYSQREMNPTNALILRNSGATLRTLFDSCNAIILTVAYIANNKAKLLGESGGRAAAE
ncbi:MAG: hypothetical protein AB7F82_03795 [Alphaproteobacteria bacterium]